MELLLQRQLTDLREELVQLQARPLLMVGRDELWRVVWRLFAIVDTLARRAP